MTLIAALLDQPAWPMFVVGTIIVLLGGGSLISEKRSPVATAFFLTTTAASMWLISASLMMRSSSPDVALVFARLTYIGVCAIPAAVLYFAATLTDSTHRLRPILAAVGFASTGFALLFATTNILLSGVSLRPWGYYIDLTPAAGLFLLFFAGVLVGSLFVLVRALRADVSWQQRNRIVSFMAALVVGYGGAIDFLPSFGSLAAPSGYIGVLGFVGLSFYAVRRYRLVDLSASIVADQLLESLDGGVIVADTRGIIRLANPGAGKLLGYRPESLTGTNIRAIVKSRELPALETPTLTRLGRASRVLRVAQSEGVEIELSVSASLLRDRERLPVGILYVIHDLAERRRAEVHEFAANHDPLTGVSNRTRVVARFDDVRAESMSRGRVTALFFIDLDGFKIINDRHGHGVGDQILQSIASRLRNALRSEDLFARWGGDEFVALLSLGSGSDAHVVREKLAAVMREPLALGSLTIAVSASVGVALCPQDGETLEQLVQVADTAMYKEKRSRTIREDRVQPSPIVIEGRA